MESGNVQQVGGDTRGTVWRLPYDNSGSSWLDRKAGTMVLGGALLALILGVL